MDEFNMNKLRSYLNGVDYECQRTFENVEYIRSYVGQIRNLINENLLTEEKGDNK